MPAPEPPRGAAGTAPSAWVRRWSHLVAPGSRVLDVACGSGRHVRWFAQRGCAVTGADRDAAALAGLADVARCVVADLEAGPWPFAPDSFDAVIVTNYLWRPRLAQVLASLAQGGVLLYETFSAGQETIGKPSNPDFLLRPGELLQLAQGLRVVAFEDGYDPTTPRHVQRIVAVRQAAGAGPGQRYRLAPADDPGGQVKS